MTQTTSTPARLRARDGFVLAARHFAPTTAPQARPAGAVVIAPATGVKATYYRRYAEFLAGHGFHAVTSDYRAVRESREPFAVARQARWADWRALDADAVLGWARTHLPGPLLTVGHSYGGFGIGLADEARHVARHVAVGG
ncbi:alpha/beta hydrolase, partial [Micrococcus sp. HSID17227]